MNLQAVIDTMLLPALQIIKVADSKEARVMILAIGLQESQFKYRRQMGNGPAKSYWQFERGGGVRGVLRHPASAAKAKRLCEARQLPAEEFAVWNAMEFDDVLGAGMARLLLLTDPSYLPEIDDVDGSWDVYARNWRPGKPHPNTWAANHLAAVNN